MKTFVRRYASRILGILRGFDRIRFRGTFRNIAHVDGMAYLLNYLRVLLKDFQGCAEQTTLRFRAGVEGVAQKAGLPIVYLGSADTNKEKLVDAVLKRQRVAKGGLIAVYTTVEVCRSYRIYRNRQTKTLDLQLAPRKCLHYYVYLQDTMFGRVHVRMQTWFPFNVHVVINGREWLAQQMNAARLGYLRRDNCFARIDDFAKAQRLCDGQLRIDWTKHLSRLLHRANPVLCQLLAPWEMTPYWSAEQSEWATDIAFRSTNDVKELYPHFVEHAMRNFDSRKVMRFLGRNVKRQQYINGHFKGEVVSDTSSRPEGVRVKHRVKGNAIKMYDKQGSVLRVETTINDARDLKAYRAKEGDPKGAKQYRPLRKGVGARSSAMLPTIATWRRWRPQTAPSHSRHLRTESASPSSGESVATELSTPSQGWTPNCCKPSPAAST